ncbi:hypothetical protein J6590_085611 [Homalodisca vitripennis]|nr:hypothetical protein J6590_085611 [Homalodisca vitripennis]
MDNKYRLRAEIFVLYAGYGCTPTQSTTQAHHTTLHRHKRQKQRNRKRLFPACVQQYCSLIGLVRGGLVSVSPSSCTLLDGYCCAGRDVQRWGSNLSVQLSREILGRRRAGARIVLTCDRELRLSSPRQRLRWTTKTRYLGIILNPSLSSLLKPTYIPFRRRISYCRVWLGPCHIRHGREKDKSLSKLQTAFSKGTRQEHSETSFPRLYSVLVDSTQQLNSLSRAISRRRFPSPWKLQRRRPLLDDPLSFITDPN